MNTYQKILLIVLISVTILLFGIFFLKKSDNVNDVKDVKDDNLKISINLVTKENYEETPTPTNNQEYYYRCNRILSLLGDSDNKGINDIYKNITGKTSPLKLPIDCSKVNLNELKLTIFIMINEMSLKSIENEDKEKGYNDLIALFLIVFKKLSRGGERLNIAYDSKGKVETIELIIDNRNTITPSKWIENMILSADVSNEPQGITPEITEQIKKAKDKAKNIVNLADLENLKNNNNSKMKVNDFGVILSHLIAKNGTFLR